LATIDNEVDLLVSYLERTIRVTPFWWWWWRALLGVIVIAVVVVLATSIIMPIIAAVIALVITAIIPPVVIPIIAVIFVTIAASVVIASVIMAVVVAILTSIPVVVATVGSTVALITSIRSTVAVVVMVVAVLVIIIVALGLLGFEGYPEGTLQLLTLPRGMFGVAVELTLVVHDHVEVTLEEGAWSWWICHIGFTGLLARSVSTVVVILSIEVVHYYVLSVDQLINVSHEVDDGVNVSFIDFLEELDVGDSLLVVGDDVLVLDTREGVAVLKVAVGLLVEGFVASHPHSGEVVSVTRSVVGRLVVGREQPGQCCPGGDALCWEIIDPQDWCLAHHKGEVSRRVGFIASRGMCHIFGSEGPSYFSIAGLKSLGYMIVLRHRENTRKLLTAPGLADGAYAIGMT
jgi:hypothetical protein